MGEWSVVPDEEKWSVVPDAAPAAPVAAPARPTSGAEAGERGALQGATLGFGDELAAAVDAGISKIPLVRDLAERVNKSSGGSGPGLPVNDPNITYAQRRDAYRGANASAQEQHPKTYLGGQLGGALATARAVPALGAGLGGAVATNALVGGAAGAGESTAASPLGVAADAGKGALLGGALGGVLHGAGAAVRALSPAAAGERNVTRALENIEEKASQKTRRGLDTPGVEKLVREEPAIKTAAASGGDSKLAATLKAAKTSSGADLERIYSTAPQEVSPANAVANMDARISELMQGDSESRAVGKALKSVRDEFHEAHGNKTSITPRELRDEQSAYQRTSYGKGKAQDSIGEKADKEASKAVGDAVMRHVTGMGYAEAKAAAAADPNGIAAQLLTANERFSSINRIEAGIADRAKRVQPKESATGKLMEIAKEVKHSPLGFVAGQAPTVAARAGVALDRTLERGAPAADALAKFVAAAKAGNPFAARLISTLSATPQGAARIAAASAVQASQ